MIKEKPPRYYAFLILEHESRDDQNNEFAIVPDHLKEAVKDYINDKIFKRRFRDAKRKETAENSKKENEEKKESKDNYYKK